MFSLRVLLITGILALALTNNTISAAAPVVQESGQEYIVQSGDWLSKLAETYYGDVQAWPIIVEATNTRAAINSSFAFIEDPNLIEVGQKLWIPFDMARASRPMTTVLLVRHAERESPCAPDEKLYPNDDICLNAAGKERAQQLARVALKAGIAAIYSTQTNRTMATAQPLANALNLQIENYASAEEVVQRVMSEHVGQVVLIVSHSGTVESIVTALGGEATSCTIGDEFDNLCVVTLDGSGSVKVVNLQYGQPSPPATQ